MKVTMRHKVDKVGDLYRTQKSIERLDVNAHVTGEFSSTVDDVVLHLHSEKVHILYTIVQ